MDWLIQLTEKLGLGWAVVLGLAYWLTKDFFPWLAPYAGRYLDTKIKQLDSGQPKKPSQENTAN